MVARTAVLAAIHAACRACFSRIIDNTLPAFAHNLRQRFRYARIGMSDMTIRLPGSGTPAAPKAMANAVNIGAG
jgi:hypothetical protein